MKINRSKKIIITISSILVIIILISFIIFQKLSNIGITHVSYSFSIKESKDLDVFVCKYKSSFEPKLIDSLKLYNISCQLDNLECWLEYGFKYKPMFFYYKVSKFDHFRLNYDNLFKVDSLNRNQFYLTLKGTDCKNVALFQDFVSMKLDTYSDTVVCDAYVFIEGNNKACRYIGDVLLIKQDLE